MEPHFPERQRAAAELDDTLRRLAVDLELIDEGVRRPDPDFAAVPGAAVVPASRPPDKPGRSAPNRPGRIPRRPPRPHRRVPPGARPARVAMHRARRHVQRDMGRAATTPMIGNRAGGTRSRSSRTARMPPATRCGTADPRSGWPLDKSLCMIPSLPPRSPTAATRTPAAPSNRGGSATSSAGAAPTRPSGRSPTSSGPPLRNGRSPAPASRYFDLDAVRTPCPRRVCRTCGTPSRRETVPDEDYLAVKARKHRYAEGDRLGLSGSTFTAQHTTTGWSTCGCTGPTGCDSTASTSAPAGAPASSSTRSAGREQPAKRPLGDRGTPSA
jgi:hypothetical protein